MELVIKMAWEFPGGLVVKILHFCWSLGLILVGEQRYHKLCSKKKKKKGLSTRRSACVLSHLSHISLCNAMDCSPADSSVHEIFQARILAWVAISFSRGCS